MSVHNHNQDSVVAIRMTSTAVVPPLSPSESQNFPMKLHQCLTELERDGKGNIASFQPHGRCFLVHKQNEFVSEVLPRWFNQTKYSSFQRQLNLYGFQRITAGLDKHAYFHPLFLRGQRASLHRIQRIRLKGNGPRRPASANMEPNFYTMPYLLDAVSSGAAGGTSSEQSDKSQPPVDAVNPVEQQLQQLASPTAQSSDGTLVDALMTALNTSHRENAPSLVGATTSVEALAANVALAVAGVTQNTLSTSHERLNLLLGGLNSITPSSSVGSALESLVQQQQLRELLLQQQLFNPPANLSSLGIGGSNRAWRSHLLGHQSTTRTDVALSQRVVSLSNMEMSAPLWLELATAAALAPPALVLTPSSLGRRNLSQADLLVLQNALLTGALRRGAL